MEKKYFTVEEFNMDNERIKSAYSHTGCEPSMYFDSFTRKVEVKLGWWSSKTDRKIEDAVRFAKELSSAVEDVKKLQKKYENAYIKFRDTVI